MASILLVRPRFDPATVFLFEWTNDVSRLLSDHNFANDNIIELSQSAATAKAIQEALEKNRSSDSLFLFFDHGQYSKLFAQDREVFVTEGNAEILESYMVYAFACESAKVLGPAAVSKGATCYLGFDEPFGFIINKLDDFKSIAVTPAIILLAGKTFAEAYQKTYNLLDRLVDKFYAAYDETGDVSDYLAAVWAFKDREAWTLLGDSNAHI